MSGSFEKMYYLSSIIKSLDTDGLYVKQTCNNCNIVFKPESENTCAYKGCNVTYCLDFDCSAIVNRRADFDSCLNKTGTYELRCPDHTLVCNQCYKYSTTETCYCCKNKRQPRPKNTQLELVSEIAHSFGYKLKKRKRKRKFV